MNTKYKNLFFSIIVRKRTWKIVIGLGVRWTWFIFNKLLTINITEIFWLWSRIFSSFWDMQSLLLSVAIFVVSIDMNSLSNCTSNWAKPLPLRQSRPRHDRLALRRKSRLTSFWGQNVERDDYPWVLTTWAGGGGTGKHVNWHKWWWWWWSLSTIT